MGPKKAAPDAKKGKAEENPDPEYATELMKSTFQLEMVEIDRRTARHRQQQKDLEASKLDIESKMEEFENEKRAIITELKGQVEEKEKERQERRVHMYWSMEEVKARVVRYKQRIQNMESEFEVLVKTMTKKLDDLDQLYWNLEDFKQNRDAYAAAFAAEEAALEGRERQHQKNLFDIQGKLKVGKVRLKKELESRLLQLSIDFQETTESKIGNSTHRLIQENISIENELKIMSDDLIEYEVEYSKARRNIKSWQQKQKARERDQIKYTSKSLVQTDIIKELQQKHRKLVEKVKEFEEIEAENKSLTANLIEAEVELSNKQTEESELRRILEDRIQEAARMTDVAALLKKNARKLQVLLRSAIKVAEEVIAVQLIPIGATEEELGLPYDARMRLYQRRRDSVFNRRGKILNRLFEALSRAQMSEEEKRMLAMSSETIRAEFVNFSEIFGKKGALPEREQEEEMELLEPVKLPSVASSASDVSLPRLVSTESFLIEASVESEESGGGAEGAEGEARASEDEGLIYPEVFGEADLHLFAEESSPDEEEEAPVSGDAPPEEKVPVAGESNEPGEEL